VTALLVLPLAFIPPPLALQAQAIAAGRVLRPAERDTSPAPGIRVVLHRVGRQLQGPVDSAFSDARGHFRIRFRPDTSALYLLSAGYGGIEYFSPPVHTNPARPDTAIQLLVYDTSSTAPVSVVARHIVVPRPGEDGSRPVLELFVLRNAGLRARVAPDTLHPSWSMPLPAGSVGLDLGESDVSPDAVSRRRDSAIVVAPISPGEKQLALQYLLPGALRVVNFPLGAGSGTVNLLVEEAGAKLKAGALARGDSQLIEGRWFRRWTGEPPAHTSLSLALPSPGRAPGSLLVALVGGLALVLVAAGWRVWNTGSQPVARATASPIDSLIGTIAALDLRYAGKESETSQEEWARYREERARLKAILEASLAGHPRAP
jgi:hypothetical protein